MGVEDELRATVREFLRRECPSPRGVTSERATEIWRRLSGELGLTGLAVPEQFGGAGYGMRELAVACEELGRTLTPVPFLPTALAALAAPEQGLADGSLTGTIILTLDAVPHPTDPRAGALERPTDGVPDGNQATGGGLVVAGGRLSGMALRVMEGLSAGVMVCQAGNALHAVRDAERVEQVGHAGRVERVERVGRGALDSTRPLADVRFDGVVAERLDMGVGRLRDLAVTALAAEQVGGAQRCLEMAVEHARARVQFGRPIGSFQAVKHKLADVLLHVESARSAAYEAARVADEDPAALPVYAALAGSYCTEAYLHAAGENIQIHGGIGVTWEHDAHLYFKRATASAHLFGSPESHRTRLTTTAGL